MKTLVETENIEESFVINIIEELEKIDSILNDHKPLIMSTSDQELFDSASICFFCKNEFSKINNKYIDKVMDHDHINGKYRCAAHNSCNLKYSKNISFVPVFFHNLGGKINNINLIFNIYFRIRLAFNN
jgi:hypothetical protein